jgi:single-strand DNA-binding protein
MDPTDAGIREVKRSQLVVQKGAVMSVNKMILIGNLGGDPELKTVGDRKVCQFSVACNEKWNDKQGNKQEHVEWTTIVVWGPQAEACAKFLKKGRQVYVEGSKRTRTYDDKDGVKRYIVECRAEKVTFLGEKPEGGSSSQREPDHGAPSHGPDDDIPFASSDIRSEPHPMAYWKRFGR